MAVCPDSVLRAGRRRVQPKCRRCTQSATAALRIYAAERGTSRSRKLLRSRRSDTTLPNELIYDSRRRHPQGVGSVKCIIPGGSSCPLMLPQHLDCRRWTSPDGQGRGHSWPYHGKSVIVMDDQTCMVRRGDARGGRASTRKSRASQCIAVGTDPSGNPWQNLMQSYRNESEEGRGTPCRRHEARGWSRFIKQDHRDQGIDVRARSPARDSKRDHGQHHLRAGRSGTAMPTLVRASRMVPPRVRGTHAGRARALPQQEAHWGAAGARGASSEHDRHRRSFIFMRPSAR